MTELLRCPATHQALAPAPAPLVADLRARRASLRNRDGESPADFEAGLLTSDAAWFYPVRDGIPVLLPGEAVVMGKMVPGPPRAEGGETLPSRLAVGD